jgi:hypothetical protein
MRSQPGKAILGSLLLFFALAGGWGVAAGRRLPPCELEVPLLVRCKLVVVHGLVGSEKVPFFNDEEVVHEFRRHGLTVKVAAAGSRTMACPAKLVGYDFVFPGSPWLAEAAAQAMATDQPLEPVEVFESPIVVATFKQVAEALGTDTVRVVKDHKYFDVERYLNTIFFAGKRWRDLHVVEPYPGSQRAVLMSTRLDTSNSAEMYLALASYVANGNRTIGPQDVDTVRPRVADLFRAQGSTGLSSEEPFEQYLSPEGYQLPMQVMYEAQFLAANAAKLHSEVVLPDGTSVPLDRVMLYPRPTVVSTHTLAPFDTWGQQVANLLTTDATLRRLTAEHGFRPVGDPGTFDAVVQEQATGIAEVDLPTPRVPLLPPLGLWNEFVSAVVGDVYGKGGASAGCG